MEHCRDCNATLRKDEEVCYGCGAATRPKVAGSAFRQKFSSFLTFALIGSGLLTAGSLFFEHTPPFMTCVMVTFVLLMVKSSANQMLEKPD